jgi:hypothetical protein
MTMARIILLDADRHEEIRKLLPWYETGRLAAAEAARVEAHLRDCADCQAELRSERELHAAVAGLELDVEHGWSELRSRLDVPPAAADRTAGRARVRAVLGGRGRRWALAATVALAVAAGLALPRFEPARYRTLGAAPPAAAGNLIVVFQPDTAERDLRGALRASGARLVDGPTAADAYVLRAPAESRPAALAKLRSDPHVVLAEPIDPAGSP